MERHLHRLGRNGPEEPLRRLWWLVAVFVLAGIPSWAIDLTVTMSVDATVVAVNQPFTLIVEYSGAQANDAPTPELPDLSDFATYLGASGTSSSFQFINGRMSVSKTFTFRYLAVKEGEFEIPPVQVSYKGEVFKAQPVKVQVVKSPAPAAQPRPGQQRPQMGTEGGLEENLFLRAIVDRRRVYQHQPVVVTFRIYTRVEVTNYAITKLPTTTGFWAEEVPLPQQPVQRHEVVDGRQFVVADLKKMMLFPTTAGKVTIDAMGIECEVRQPRTRRTRDFFDSFFDDPFFDRVVRKAIYSAPITVEVLPLPEAGRPDDFAGAVGSFHISAGLDKSEVETNEAVTLTVRIGGTGNVMMIREPKVSIPPDLEQYKPKVNEEINRSGEAISGAKTFEYVLVPRFPGEHRIKPISFSYFDLASSSYRTVSTPELVLRVRKGARQVASVGGAMTKEEVRLVGQDIRFIKTDVRLYRRGGQAMIPRFAWALTVFPLLVLGAAVVYRRHVDRLAGDVAYARSRRANRLAMRRLHKAKGLIGQKTEKEFYAEVGRSLLGYVADKLNTSAAGLLSEEVERQLLARGVPSPQVEALMACLRECDYRRFAPISSSVEQMKQFYERAKDALVGIESAF
ncbi:MAG: BatD family protein [candidate division KSB1 bacterium]|nr:BatD family protein [candidate division KSB1 bacterium]MDZ7386545.1 BatD family protein [candidate division KSB1 bacterium]MDZ7393375.1 BatD family protein [candidate division KSB1 bacterium]